MDTNTSKKANALINETSPYLLQHAYNPVNWQAYSEKAFLEAEANDKLVVISIGYSTCHWCHVMEHESFEDIEVASLMNEYYINIKVDREERPDIDAVYMQAVQLMTGRGGWPLNVIVLPDKRTIYGGTYFPKAKWMEILKNIHNIWENDRAQVYTYAENLLSGMHQTSLLLEVNKENIDFEIALQKGIEADKKLHDHVNGGSDRAPKFPMPVNYMFRYNYANLYKDEALLKHVHKTLNFMALGGIYDQVGGGFFRYSTDAYWKVPHFEKMLYDNAQLLQLYAYAHKHSPQPEYARVCEGIYTWLISEMKAPNGGFYAALDADSEGIEGKFYIYTKIDLELALDNLISKAASIYEINAEGYWEDGNYIMLRSELNPNTQSGNHDYEQDLKEINTKLKAYRDKRVRPGTDTKIICSWNALLVCGLVEYYKCSLKPDVKKEAQELVEFLIQNLIKDSTIYRTPEAKIEGTLEDYALLCTACIDVATISSNPEKFLEKAKEILIWIEEKFDKESNGFFAMASKNTKDLLLPVYEVQDNVIASANALHSFNKVKLAHIFAERNWEEEVESQLIKILPSFSKYPEAYSKWADIGLLFTKGYTQTVLTGPEAEEQSLKEYISTSYLSDIFILSKESHIPLFENRFNANQNLKFTCYGHQCDLPESF